MSRKKEKKASAATANDRGKATVETRQPKEDQHEDGGKTDYGGIPDRDLKKNLGCG